MTLLDDAVAAGAIEPEQQDALKMLLADLEDVIQQFPPTVAPRTWLMVQFLRWLDSHDARTLQ
jgi:hypothetical protein